MLVSDLIARTKADLYGNERGLFNLLASSITTTDTQLTTTYDLAALSAGAYLGIEDELIYVWVSPAPKTLTIQRGMLGTTPAAHAAGTFIEVQPRFPQFVIRNALQDEINSWPNGLYSVASVSLSVSAWQRGIDAVGIPSNWLRILEVRRAPLPGLDSWPEVKVRAERNADPTQFPSGTALYLNRIMWTSLTWPQVSSAFTLRVTYAVPFTTTTFTDATDLVATCGLDQDLLDIPRLGACWRLLGPREASRTSVQAQAESRDQREVPTGMTQRVALGMKAQRDDRIRQEVERRISSYGWRGA